MYILIKQHTVNLSQAVCVVTKIQADSMKLLVHIYLKSNLEVKGKNDIKYSTAVDRVIIMF